MLLEKQSEFKARAFLAKCLVNYRVYAVVVFLALLLGMATALFSSPQYTAAATVGPRRGNPLSIGGGNLLGTASLGRQLTGSSNSDDLFTQYAQLLQSNRVSRDMAGKYKMLPVIFPSRWDFEKQQWKEPSVLTQYLKQVYSWFSHRPARRNPDADDMQAFLISELQISKIAPLTSSPLFRGTTLLSVSISLRNPAQAQAILAAVLDDADTIIREDQKRNSAARIVYLEETLPKVTLAEERAGMVSALTNEREDMAALEADERYASSEIDPPHASMVPISPRLFQILLIAFVLGILAATAIVYFRGAAWLWPPEFFNLRLREREFN